MLGGLPFTRMSFVSVSVLFCRALRGVKKFEGFRTGAMLESVKIGRGEGGVRLECILW
jgi:hypothetical protein